MFLYLETCFKESILKSPRDLIRRPTVLKTDRFAENIENWSLAFNSRGATRDPQIVTIQERGGHGHIGSLGSLWSPL
jgi:hypothetical protein